MAERNGQAPQQPTPPQPQPMRAPLPPRIHALIAKLDAALRQ